MMALVVNIVVSVLILVGAFFSLAASIGVLRLPDIYSRMHSASKAGTVGSGLALVGLAIYAGTIGDSTRAIAAVVFFLLTAPIAAHLLAKAAHDMGYPLWKGSVKDERAESDGSKERDRAKNTSR